MTLFQYRWRDGELLQIIPKWSETLEYRHCHMIQLAFISTTDHTTLKEYTEVAVHIFCSNICFARN